MNKFKKVMGIFLVLMIVSACSKIPQNKEEEKVPTDNNAVLEIDKDILTPQEIVEMFNKETSNAYKIKQIEFSNTSKVYKIDGFGTNDEIEIKLDGKTGSVLIQNLDDLDKDNKEITDKHLAAIDKFVEMALNDAGDHYNLKQWELDYDNNRYEIEIELIDKNHKDIDYTYNIETEELIKKDM